VRDEFIVNLRSSKQLGGSSIATDRVEMCAAALDGYKDQPAAARNPN
jgi:hypothetical protein